MRLGVGCVCPPRVCCGGRDVEEGGYANGDTNGHDPKQLVMRHSLSQARSQKVRACARPAVTANWAQSCTHQAMLSK